MDKPKVSVYWVGRVGVLLAYFRQYEHHWHYKYICNVLAECKSDAGSNRTWVEHDMHTYLNHDFHLSHMNFGYLNVTDNVKLNARLTSKEE